MLGLGAIGQFAIGEQTIASPETIGPDKWYERLSEPVRTRQALLAAEQSFLAFAPQPQVSFSWMEPLSEPVRSPPRSPAALAPFYFYQPMPSPFAATGWFEPMSEPVRTRPALPAALNPFFTGDTVPIPTTKLIEWYARLSEPVRSLPGLAAALQQFLAQPPQLRPNPALTAYMIAVETRDVFLAGAVDFNRPLSGEIGVVEQASTGGEIGVVRQGSTGPGVVRASIAIAII